MKILRFLDENFEKYICAIILVLMTLIMFYQIITRYFGFPLAWTEETARYLFIWLIYLSASYAAKIGAHIKVDILLTVFKSRKILLTLRIFSNTIFFIFSAVVTYLMYGQVTNMLLNTHQLSATGNWPMWIPYSSVLVGMFLISIRLIQNSIMIFKEHNNKNLSTGAKVGSNFIKGGE